MSKQSGAVQGRNITKGVKYDITTTERCPLCGEDIQVGTAGPQGLAQHRGKKKRLATAKKKEQDAVMAREPTLFSYLCRKDTTLPTPTDLAREVERNDAEDASRVVVSRVTIPKVIPETTYTAQHADHNAQGNDKDAVLSADLDLDSDLDRDLDLDELLAWSTVKARARIGEREPGCEP